MEKEKISIIVPVYNVENYLEKCLESIINQSYKNLEIILIDDGSIDNSGRICDEYAQKDTRIKVIHKENGGLSDARNKGIEIATGVYISFIDSDDWVEYDMYETLYHKIKINNADISICGRYLDYSNGKSVNIFPTDIENVYNNIEALIALNSFSFFDMSACAKLYKIGLYSEIRYPIRKKM